jgi:hypothetical protein
MLVSNVKQPTVSVKAAGIIAIVGSVLVLLGSAFGFLGVLMLRRPTLDPSSPGLRASSAKRRWFSSSAWPFLGCSPAWACFVSKSGLAFSALIWSGMTAVICALIIIVSIFVPLPTAPNSTNTPAHFLTYLPVASVVFYGLPLAIAIWWLILFNRKKVTTRFVASDIRGTLDPSGFPIEAPAPSKPELPLPIAVFAGFLLLSSVSVFLVFLVRMPVLLFAHALRGPSGIAAWIVTCLLSTMAGIGLLRRQVWSYWLTFA